MEFLLEIMTEEMPSSHVQAGLEQLRNKFEEELTAERIKFANLRPLGTCRRLIITADLEEKQADREEKVLGPPKKVAFAEDGTPLPAAYGFARAQGVTLEELQVFPTAKGEYIGVMKKEKGKETRELLPLIIPRVLASLSFPKMMRWGESGGKFSRPVKNLFCLFNGEPLAFSFEDWPWRPWTYGHRLHSYQPLQVRSLAEYLSELRKNLVLVDPEERRRLILSQAEACLQPWKAKIYPDEELLKKIVFDVEYPLVIVGSFPEKYLILPIEIISTALREGQRLFSVVREKKQLSLFIAVADHSDDAKGLIKKGHERVIKARLEDALFFWNQDLKVPLQERVSQLAGIIFQEKLGTYLDKTERVKKLVTFLIQQLGEKGLKREAAMAAELAKVDLLTEMVREFPSLQGRVGGLYGQAQGLPRSVTQAIYEHYQPLSLEDASPSSLLGAILSLADKVDSLIGPIGLGAEVSGSSDPLGLRRYAHGICKIILDHKLRLSLSQLLKKAISLYGEKLAVERKELISSCLSFFEQRLRYIFEKMGFRYDLVNAALGVGIDDVYLSFLRLKALEELKSSPEFEPLVLMVRRVNNILRGQTPGKFTAQLLKEKEERELWATFEIVKQHGASLIGEGDFPRAQKMAFKLRTPLEKFFDRVLVMAEDKKIRENRLSLLSLIGHFLFQIADFSQVVLETEKES